MFTTVREAVEALDRQRDDWTRLRDDYQEDAFLGTRGHSWHRQIIKRTVIEAGFDFRLVPVLHMNSTDSYLVDGVANDRYLVDDEWVQPYELDSPEDNPRDNPRNWQHIVAVVKGNIKRTFTSVRVECLHLDLPTPKTPEPSSETVAQTRQQWDKLSGLYTRHIHPIVMDSFGAPGHKKLLSVTWAPGTAEAPGPNAGCPTHASRHHRRCHRQWTHRRWPHR